MLKISHIEGASRQKVIFLEIQIIKKSVMLK